MLTHTKWSQKDYKFTQAGFGLVACMGMLAVILVIIAGLMPLVSSYARLALNSKYKSQAKENARYGLSLALAELQMHMGPDERATSWALNSKQELEALDPEKRYWLGVWEPLKWNLSESEAQNNAESEKGRFHKWLVSSTSTAKQADQEAVLEQKSLEIKAKTDQATMAQIPLVTFSTKNGANSEKAQEQSMDVELVNVCVDVVELPDQTEKNLKSYYAYWIGDESLKIPLGFLKKSSDLAVNSTGKLQGSCIIDETSMLALGVASNPIEGGLKCNLRDPAVCDSEAIIKLADFWKTFPAINEAGLKNKLDDDPLQKIQAFSKLSKALNKISDTNKLSTIAHKLYPVITQFEINWGLDLVKPEDTQSVIADADDPEVVLKCMVSVTLWNPYNIPLKTADYSIKYAFEESVNTPFYIKVVGEPSRVLGEITLNPPQTTKNKSNAGIKRAPIFQGTIKSAFAAGAIKKFYLEGKREKTRKNKLVQTGAEGNFCYINFLPLGSKGKKTSVLTLQKICEHINNTAYTANQSGPAKPILKLFYPNIKELQNTFLELSVKPKKASKVTSDTNKTDKKRKPKSDQAMPTCQKISLQTLPFGKPEGDIESIPINITNEYDCNHALLGCILTLKPDRFTDYNPFAAHIDILPAHKSLFKSAASLSELTIKDLTHPVFHWSYDKRMSLINAQNGQQNKYIPLHENTRDTYTVFPLNPALKKSLLEIPAKMDQFGTLCLLNFSFSDYQLYYPLGNSRCPNYLSEVGFHDHYCTAPLKKEVAADSTSQLSEKIKTSNSESFSAQKIDLSFCLNHILWDAYFWPHGDEECQRFSSYEQDSTPNNTLKAKDYLLQMPFNINNTSVCAWKQLIQYCHAEAKTKWSETHNDAAVTLCAKKLVQEIQRRGPFMTLGAFINRDLMKGERGEKGALQSALDEVKSKSDDLEIRKEVLDANTTPFDSLDARFYMNLVGRNLTTRGDTFIVRAYGAVKDPNTGKPQAEARCEAGVQRLPYERYELKDDNNTKQPIDRKFRIIYFRWL